ncbi:hypothetical protein ACP26C_10125 [Franconibacter helveticus 513]|uniref:hypothetical protein n=1 Tax=Franconibacter helveticus TaxID=357240 RepID=UPI000426A832|nr:hypothetical protein [Franconibacter helveticus]
MTMLSSERLHTLATRPDDSESASLPSPAEWAAMACELLEARQKIAALEKQLMRPVTLPFTSASPVCEIEAGYAAGVNDCKTAIRAAGFFIEGDD